MLDKVAFGPVSFTNYIRLIVFSKSESQVGSGLGGSHLL
jgi:hypothetical protein